MTHFAQVNGDGIVTTVIVAEQDFIDAQPGEWVQTSYNTRGGKHFAPNSNIEDDGTALLKNYAGIGYTYVAGIGFHAPQPYPSWTLDSDTFFWEPPVAYPDDGKRYAWDEDTTSWVEVED